MAKIEYAFFRSRISRSVFLNLSREGHGGWKGLDCDGRTYLISMSACTLFSGVNSVAYLLCRDSRKSNSPGTQTADALFEHNMSPSDLQITLRHTLRQRPNHPKNLFIMIP